MNRKKTNKKPRLQKKEFLYGNVRPEFVPASLYQFMIRHGLKNVDQLLEQYSFLELWEFQILDNDSKHQLFITLKKYGLLDRLRIGKILP